MEACTVAVMVLVPVVVIETVGTPPTMLFP